jgi:hypothetical protein
MFGKFIKFLPEIYARILRFYSLKVPKEVRIIGEEFLRK